MVKVYVTKAGQYSIKTPKIKAFLRSFFKREGIVSTAFVSVAIVSEKKMQQLGRKYYPNDNKTHNVFSFVENESGEFKSPTEAGINLGEIVVCYPIAVKEAISEGKLIDKKILELIEHAGEHLLGRHHEE